MQLKAFALVLAFQTGRSGAKLVAQGHLQTEHVITSDVLTARHLKRKCGASSGKVDQVTEGGKNTILNTKYCKFHISRVRGWEELKQAVFLLHILEMLSTHWSKTDAALGLQQEKSENRDGR